MSKIIVTGAGGFLGKHIASLLKLEVNSEIINLSRTHHVDLDAIGVETVPCDISNKEQVQALDLSGVEAIFHVAALAGVWGREETFYNINYLGTKYLTDHAKKSGVKYFIYTSTPSVVFGKEDIINGDEKQEYPDKYYTSYARTKSLAEKYVKDMGDEDFRTISLRPHLIWGPGDPHLIPRIVAKARLGKLKMVGDGENMVDIIYVKNAAMAHIQAFKALKDKPELSGNHYFIGQERPVNLWDFINQILEKKNLRPVDGHISFQVSYFLGAVFEAIYKLLGIYRPEPPMTRFVAMQLAKSHFFSHQKAHNDFGYTPKYTIEQGLAETFPSN